MGFVESLTFYLVIGAAVAVGHWLSEDRALPVARAIKALARCLFWPLYLPLLLADFHAAGPVDEPSSGPQDELARSIDRVDRELRTALSGVDGWAAAVLKQQPQELGDLRAALLSHASRIRQMDAIIDQEQERQEPSPIPDDVERDRPPSDLRRSQQARRDNLQHLDRIRRQARDELRMTLARIRELVSMIHLARFGDAPPGRTQELVSQIAAAVELLSVTVPLHNQAG